MLAMAGAALADDHAFQWLRIDPPAGSTLFSVNDVNNAGHLLCKLNVTGTGSRGAVYRDGQWLILEVDGNAATYITDINNYGTVVGYSGSGTGLMARIWHYNEQNGDYDPGENLGEQTQIWSINDYDELAGFDVANNHPVGWFAEQTGWTELLPLAGGNATAALALNNAGPPATIVGLSSEYPTDDLSWAVAWAGSSSPVKIDPNQLDVTDTPYIINENNWIVGARGLTNPYTYLLWRPNASGGWNSVESLGVTGTSPKSTGLNNSNEVVAKKSLFYANASGILQSVSLTTLSGVPTTTGPLGHFYSTNLAFYAINDNGWILGKATYYDPNNVDQGLAAVLLVPYDMNNNEVPDYREIIASPGLDADPITGGNWVLDVAEMMRVGLQAPTTDLRSAEILNAKVIRKMRDHFDIYNAAFADPPSGPCLGQSQEATAWGANQYNGGNYSDVPKEILINVRTRLLAATNDRDYVLPEIPSEPGELTRVDTEQALECFAARWARCIDYVQIGNEMWTRKGRYWIRQGQLPLNAPEYSGYLTNVPSAAFDEALDLVFDQLSWQVQAVRRGSALAGRPLRIVGPSSGYSTTLVGMGGDVNGNLDVPEGEDGDANANRSARFLQRLIRFCNDHDIPLDCHYIVWREEDFLNASEAIAAQGNIGWDIPEQLVSLELAAVPSSAENEPTHWWNQDVGIPAHPNSDWTSRFFDGRSRFPGVESWEPDWQEYWLAQSSPYRDSVYSLPASWPLDGFIELASRGYLLACFPCRQNTGQDTVATPLDMTAIYPDKLPQGERAFVVRWKGVFEPAAAYFNDEIVPWDPHPQACPESPCPPCEH